jgi:tetratricopeptide (TPR) repeat protein
VTNSDDQNSEQPETDERASESDAQQPELSEETQGESDQSAQPASAESEPETASDEPETDERESDSENVDGETTDGKNTDSSAAVDKESDLPDFEPLTPELVEDEAIRGDFMLRWSVVLLALLLGVRHISETPTLVHIRSGEYLTSNGILPPSNDVFSYTAADSSWVNLNWLFDIIVAACYGIGGGTALSIFTGLLAAVMFYLLVNISRPDSPTWWNAVCAAVALAVVNQQFTALPEIITLIGSVWIVRGLCKWSDDANPKTLWCLVFSLVIWSNLDPRAYIGCVIMLGYLIGTVIKPIASDADKPPLPTRDLVITTFAGILALAANPFGWHAWLSPISIYTVEVPIALRYLAGAAKSGNLTLSWLFSDTAIATHTYQWICGISLASITIVTCLVNRRHLNLGLTVAFVFVLGLGVWHSNELAITAIVGCVLASLNGQDWYNASCRQEYTTNTWEVLYGRLGRAVTVFALATVAWLGISGRLMGPNGKRVGLGFSPELAVTMQGTIKDLEGAAKGNIFTFRLDQGDLLIWANRKTFVDSRIRVFGTGGESSIIEQHDKARHALRPTELKALTVAKQLELNKIWKKILNDHNVTLAMPRLWGTPPDYRTYERLIGLPEWSMTNFGSSTAVFVRNDVKSSRKFAIENRYDFITAILQSESKDDTETTGRPDWPRLKTGYQQFLSLPGRLVSTNDQKAKHSLMHAEMLMASQVPVIVKQAIGLALATDAVRNSNTALYQNVNNPDPYQNIADAHGLLHTLENQLQAQEGYPVGGEQRYFQMIHAMRLYLTLKPDDLLMLNSLLNSYVQTQKWDLAEEMLLRCFAVLDKTPRTEAALGMRRQLSDLKKQIDPRVHAIEERVAAAKDQNKELDDATIAYGLHNAGFPLKALLLFEADKTVRKDVRAHLQYALALAECGRLEDAASQFEAFDRMGDTPAGAPTWRRHAAWVEMARGNYDGAIDLCRKRISDIEQTTLMSLLTTVPLVQPPPAFLRDDTWPVRQTAAALQTLMMSSQTAELRWTMATCYLESGRNKEAADVLKQLLDVEPDTHLRPIARTYLELITGKPVAESRSDQIPFSFYGEDFTDEDDEDESTEKPKTEPAKGTPSKAE